LSESSNRASSQVQIHSEAQLLVEGKSDRGFIEALIKRRSLGAVQVQTFEGVDNLRKFLAGFVRSPNFHRVSSLGVLRDADDDPAAAFESVCHAIQDYVGEPPAEAGILTGGQAGTAKPGVGVLIVPLNGPGMLETVLCRTFAGQPIAACIADFMACAVDAGELRQESAKACAHAYLSTRQRPGCDVGVAARQGYWDLDHAALDPIADFVRAVAEKGETGVGPRKPE